MAYLLGVGGRRGMSLEFFGDRPIKVAHCKPKKNLGNICGFSYMTTN
jgi:hypothetical protein